ncbi:MAG: hypothetical protein WEB13_00695 [Dehalococcoidia bacterium]
MPSNPRERRTRIPRRLPPRPQIGVPPAGIEHPEQPLPRGRSLRAGRSARLLERETPLVMQELKRVAGVTAVTFGLLIALTIVDRVR